MYKTTQREAFNFYESFSDLIFCTLVLFLVLVLFLALNVNQRIEGVRETENSLELRKATVMQTLQELEIEEKQIREAVEKNKLEIEKFRQLETEEARLVKLKEEVDAEDNRIEEVERKNADAAKHNEEIEKQIALITTRLDELKKEELEIAGFKESLENKKDEIEVLEKVKALVEDKQTARNRRYDTAGEDDDSGLVPCRWQYSVLLVLGRGKMTFEGETVTWDRLPRLIEMVPNKKQTVFSIAVTPDIHKDINQTAALLESAFKRIEPEKRYGFESTGFPGAKRFEEKVEPVLVALQKARQ